ncbi:uncharacterized protein TNIN_38171 [Trichonephila inaurata madagascariensis]|uniref:Uncharacterized protein n=1 Tax=Trichonephila inaurata madagascariensis TaxID=2747483 RepID=A0A8X7CGT0_9ARAC|nr:uncharacterized protein TNIN_38171 [Trichonephila inaurata madagascariensis]
MVKGMFRNWLGVTENEETIASNAAIDATQAGDITNLIKENATQAGDITNLIKENATQAGDITNLIKENATQAGDITNLIKENATQAGDITNLTETVADQEKTLLICTIATAVAVIAITSFVAFCIYQGVKLEREKEKNSLDQDTPDAKLSNVGTTDGTEKLQNNLKVANM